MSSCLRRLDSNHLIGVGDEGYFRHDFAFANQLYSGSLGVDRERLLGIPKSFRDMSFVPGLCPE